MLDSFFSFYVYDDILSSCLYSSTFRPFIFPNTILDLSFKVYFLLEVLSVNLSFIHPSYHTYPHHQYLITQLTSFGFVESDKYIDYASNGNLERVENGGDAVGKSSKSSWRRPTSCLSVKKFPSCRPSWLAVCSKAADTSYHLCTGLGAREYRFLTRSRCC